MPVVGVRSMFRALRIRLPNSPSRVALGYLTAYRRSSAFTSVTVIISYLVESFREWNAFTLVHQGGQSRCRPSSCSCLVWLVDAHPNVHRMWWGERTGRGKREWGGVLLWFRELSCWVPGDERFGKNSSDKGFGKCKGRKAWLPSRESLTHFWCLA